ncbi:hypothetical protein B0H13DRAFT_2323730 [Mycena leptocephala]|nr:hypothetical protein B0H13DRAFT_2323730 [Mycena leptocephala]
MPRTFLDTPSLPTDLGLGRRAQFRPILLDEDTNGVSAADFRDIMMEETNYLRAVDEQEDFLAKNTEALRREVENLRLHHLEAEFEGADDETIPQLAQEIRDNEMLRATGEDEDEINRHFSGVPIDHDYAPYGNKTSTEDDFVDYGRLWSPGCPSFNKFRAMQKHIRKTTGVRSEAHKSGLGNLFYVNDIRDLIAKDFANPEVAPHIQKYPEDVDGGPVSEIWQVKEGKWHNIPLDELTPSILVGHARYYIHEVAELVDGRWIIPALWIVSKEEASHIGHQGNYFCRRCLVGGTNEEKECPDGYHSFYEAGRPRNVEDIRRCVLSQISLATYGVASHVDALQTSTGTKDKIAQHWIDILIEKSREMQASTPGRSVDEISNELLVWLAEETDEPYNPYWICLFDPSQDTLVEILHTILLGMRNIHGTNFTITGRHPPIRAAYMMQYRNGLIGKHFKSLMQTMIFHIHDLVTPDQFALVRALGELGPILWMPVIDNMEEYLADLQILIDNILDARHPSARAICPSRDIAAKFADLDRVKHILSGGYWFDESESVWRHLGWAPPPFWTPGQIKAVAQKKQGKLAALTADQAMLSGAANPASIALDPATLWTDGTNVASVSGDCCTVGSWAVFRVHDFPMIARVSKILLPKGSKSAQGILVVAKYDPSEALHPHYHMPILIPDMAAQRVIVPSDSIQFSFNVQHDCRASECDASGVAHQMQERQQSDKTIHSIVHKDDTRFIINLHGFHNARLLRKYLGVALTKPRPLFAERRRRHDELSAILTVTQKAKRAATQEKAAATREKNKAAKAAGTDVQTLGTNGPSSEEIQDTQGAQKRPRIE